MAGSSFPDVSTIILDVLERFDAQMAIQTVVLCVFLFAGIKVVINSLQPNRRYRHWTRTHGSIIKVENIKRQQAKGQQDEHAVDVDGDEVDEIVTHRAVRDYTRIQYSYAAVGQTFEGSTSFRARSGNIHEHYMSGTSLQVIHHPVHHQRSRILDDNLQPRGKGRFIGVVVGLCFIGVALYLLLPEILGVSVNFGPLAR